MLCNWCYHPIFSTKNDFCAEFDKQTNIMKAWQRMPWPKWMWCVCVWKNLCSIYWQERTRWFNAICVQKCADTFTYLDIDTGGTWCTQSSKTITIFRAAWQIAVLCVCLCSCFAWGWQQRKQQFTINKHKFCFALTSIRFNGNIYGIYCFYSWYCRGMP